MSSVLKDLHDALLEERPEGVEHDALSCPLCGDVPTETASAETTDTGGNVSDEKTYTESEYNRLAEKVSSLETQIAELSEAAEAEAIDARIAEAKADLETQVADLQSKLDIAVIEAEASRTELNDVLAFLASEEAAAEEAAALEARRDERIAKVKEVASFPDDYVEANADRFVAMSDEAFEAALEDWKTIVPKAEKSDQDELPAVTAMVASRSTTNSNPDRGLLREVLNLREHGVDVRSI
jgi:DNA repair exonuclease SbcCD ATPase subunit